MNREDTHPHHRTALVTGGSAGLGRALTLALVADGWTVVTDGRRPEPLAALAAEADSGTGRVVTVPGDVADAAHRADLATTVDDASGRLDLLVHNASTLGPLPMRRLVALDDDDLAGTFAVNAAAPVALTRALLPALHAARGALLSISSDAAVAHYETWGAYGATKAALDHLVLTLAAEESLTAWVVDPGDLRTQMHADAFPGEDISDRPLPETVVPHLLGLLDGGPPSGRYRAADLPARSAGAREAVAS